MKCTRCFLFLALVLFHGAAYSGTGSEDRSSKSPIPVPPQLEEKKSLEGVDMTAGPGTNPGCGSKTKWSFFREDERDNDPDLYGAFPRARLFHTFLADPRKTVFSGSVRYDDDTFNNYSKNSSGKNSNVLGKDRFFGALSMGGRVPLYRLKLPEGSLQFNVESAIWAIFAFKSRDSSNDGELSTMLNADFMIGLPTVYAYKNFSFQYRFYHLSSHIGDELMVLYPTIKRVNFSYEAMDLFLSYYFIPQVRIYWGLGYVVHSFESYSFDPVYFEYGAEFRPFKRRPISEKVYWQPFIAAHFRNWQNNNWSIDGKYVAGFEFGPIKKSTGTVVQIYLEYYHGNSLEGQFYRNKTSFLGLTVSYEI